MIQFDLIAAICGATGALILAWSGPRAAWGWPLFLASNIGWIIHALLTQQHPLLWQTVVFTATSILGIVRGLVAPALGKLGQPGQRWGRLRQAIRQHFCKHRFRGIDLQPRDSQGMVHWPCHVCGKTYSAEYGLLISSHGRIEGPWSISEDTTTRTT